MRKEILAALAVGIGFGLVLTFGLYTLRQRLSRNITPQQIADSIRQSVSPTPTPSSRLQIQDPSQDFLSSEEIINVVGRTLPDSSVVVFSPAGEFITFADQDGDFSVAVTLKAGGNRVTVTAITPEGEKESTVLSVVYSTIDLEAIEATAEGTNAR